MSKQEVCIIGAGGHTRSLLRIIDSDLFIIKGIYDDSYSPNTTEIIDGVSVKATIDQVPSDASVIVAFGDLKKRKEYIHRFFNQLISNNHYHRSAIIEGNVITGKRNQFFARSFLNSCVNIGNDNIINSGAIIEHESVVGDNNHISIGAILCGRVHLGSNCFVGAGAVIKDKVKICSDVIIGANSLVLEDISEPGVYVGSPVRKVN